MYQKILVPLDGSKLSEAILAYVRGMTATGESEVVLLQVPDYPIYDERLMDAELVSMVRRHVDAETRGYLSAIAGDLQSNGRKVSCALGKGDIAEAILDWADRVKADLIAMSTNGRSGVELWLIGSVTDQVLHSAEIPLLVIRPRMEVSDRAAMPVHGA